MDARGFLCSAPRRRPSGHWTVEARYTVGLTNLQAVVGENFIRSGTATFMAGYTYARSR